MASNISACRIVVLISGSGSNLQALIDQMHAGLPIEIVGVISNRPQAYGLERAKQAGIPTYVLDHQDYADRSSFENALVAQIAALQPQLIVLAGFMRILSADFVHAFPGQILNIHPSLLPKFKGLHTHQQAIAAKETEHGASVHFVTADLDSGPLIAQVKVPVLPNDDADALAKRVLTAEHWLYPQVVGWFAQNRLKWSQNAVTLDGERLGPQGIQLTLPSTQGIVS